jgi:proteasome lid subunit RPN8/RPN11
MLRSSHVIAELERALRLARGREIAGLLLEDPAGDQRLRLAPNLVSEPGAIEVPRWWLERMLRRREPSEYRPVAFLHSHVSSLEPSETDRSSMQRFPLPWIILRIEAGQLSWVVLPPPA